MIFKSIKCFCIFRKLLPYLMCWKALFMLCHAFDLPESLLQAATLATARLNSSIDMNRHWTTETLILRQGYPVELHQTITQDGYTLTLQRLPRAGHQPVLLVHGLYGSATDFVIMGRNVSLAFALWDQQFDVWLANCRGSFNAQQHAHYARDSLHFWNFSFHELGVYDLPALIAYVRSNTSFHAMHFVGHSQGATALLVLAALRPAYVENLLLVQLMAPLAYFRHTKIAAHFREFIEQFLQPTSREVREFLPRGFMQHYNCSKNTQLHRTCLQLIFSLVGVDFSQIDQTKLSLIFNQFPAGGSVKQLRHLQQLYSAGAFLHYDYGFEGNYDKYAAAAPPPYNLSQLHAATVLHYAANDYLASVKDVLLLAKQLPSVRRLHLVSHADFNHLDFIWAKDLVRLVNKNVIGEFSNYGRHGI